jgi:hypothetical protein
MFRNVLALGQNFLNNAAGLKTRRKMALVLTRVKKSVSSLGQD